MTTMLPPDVGMVVGNYLRGHAAVRALVGTRVVSRTPTSTSTAWVTVNQIGAPSASASSSVLHLVAALLQLDCYAGSTNDQGEMSRIARTVCAALADMSGVFGDVVVTGVPPRLISWSRMPDADVSNPARERGVITVTVYAHAVA